MPKGDPSPPLSHPAASHADLTPCTHAERASAMPRDVQPPHTLSLFYPRPRLQSRANDGLAQIIWRRAYP
eukprot:5867388-Prymnesium_polylepis.1